MSAAEVLECDTFDQARSRYPEVIHTALGGAPGVSEEVFRAHWKPDAKYHNSLSVYIMKAAKAVEQQREKERAEREKEEAAMGPPTVEGVLGCASFDDAGLRYPQVIQHALTGGPPENVFRDNWSKDAKYHGSLLRCIAKALQTLPAKAPAPSASPKAEGPGEPDAEGKEIKVLRRANDGEFWGFLIGKQMKVLEVTKDGPAAKAGLEVGHYVLTAKSKTGGLVVCTKPGEAYGPKAMFDTTITLTVTKIKPATLDEMIRRPELKKDDKKEDERNTYSDVGFTVSGDAPDMSTRTTAWQRFSAPKKDNVDSSQVVLDYMHQKKDEALKNTGAAYQPKMNVRQIAAAAQHAGKVSGAARQAKVGDMILRRDGAEIRDGAGWKLPGNETAEILEIMRSTDPKLNGQFKLRSRWAVTELIWQHSDWLTGDGWGFANAGKEWGAECLPPPIVSVAEEAGHSVGGRDAGGRRRVADDVAGGDDRARRRPAAAAEDAGGDDRARRRVLEEDDAEERPRRRRTANDDADAGDERPRRRRAAAAADDDDGEEERTRRRRRRSRSHNTRAK